MTATTETTWLDVMPAIPLDDYRGPAIDGDGVRCVVVGVGPGWVDVAYRRTLSPTGDVPIKRWAPNEVRPALDEPQGFGYALRWLSTRASDEVNFEATCAVIGGKDAYADMQFRYWRWRTDRDLVAGIDEDDWRPLAAAIRAAQP